MKIKLSLIKKTEREIFLNVYQFYIYEMSCFYEKYLGEKGLFDFDTRQFDMYWDQEEHWPYFIFVDSNIAGFCLARRYPDDNERYDVEQYFVLNHYKRKRVGATALQSLVSMHAGKWQVRILPSNSPALHFWEESIARVSNTELIKTQKQESGVNMHFIYFEKYYLTSCSI